MAADVAVLETTETATGPLQVKYRGLAEEYRNLGTKQLDSASGLTSEETARRQELQELSTFGLFEELPEKQLGELESEYRAEKDAEAQGINNPTVLRGEYNSLLTESSDEGLTSPAKRARLRWLSRLRTQKKI